MDQQQSFMDSKTILAIVLMALIWFGWNSYMAKKYPKTAMTEKVEAPKAETQKEAPPLVEAKKPGAVTHPTTKVTELIYEDDTWKFSVSSAGMGITQLNLKKFTDRKNNPIRLGDGSPHIPLASQLGDELIDFNLTETSPGVFLGEAVKSGIKITKTLRVDSQNYMIYGDVRLSGDLSKAKKFSFLIAEQSFSAANQEGSGKQMGSDDKIWQSYFISHAGTNDHAATTEGSPLRSTYDKVSVAALNGKYFGQALVDDSKILPQFATDYNESSKLFLGWLNYDLTGQQQADIKLKFFGGPKSLDILTKADARLEKSVNYGVFGVLASPLLKLMKWLYGLTHNYGVAIILMTLLVRIAVMPFNVASYKSMKAMQVIQPQVNKLKEKYKNDPQAMNREMMKLMKENNANPLMGCLPMLLQLPVFFALYQVLDHSIELYKAPFALWIHDLSLKDPYFVLPVLMGITMFIQQKITPTTMDPAQAKIMLIMPVVFSLMMMTLPSGLTLYIFISTLFGIIQQFLFMRDRKSPTTTAIQAKA